MFQNQTEDIALNKLIILFTINVSPNPLYKEKLMETLMTINDTNYFLLQQYLSELIHSKMISQVEDEKLIHYILNKKAVEALEHFGFKIPEDIMTKIKKHFNIQSVSESIKTTVESTTYPKDNGEYNVNLKIIENGDTIFSLYISVPNKSQSDELCRLWEDSPDYYFKSILDLFIKS